MKINIFDKMQRFGAAMFIPVAFLPLVGLLLAFIQVFKNPMLVGGLAGVESFQHLLMLLEEGSWTIFRQMPIIFALGFPATMAKRAPERAVVTTLVTLLSFHYILNAILTIWGANLGIDFTQNPGGTSGLSTVAGVKTLDMNIVGGMMVGAITVWLHNKFFDLALPKALSFFQGMALVGFISMLLMIPLAVITVFVWPPIQVGIASMQNIFVQSGTFGIWLYTFMERILIPTGLHHFIYNPFVYGDAVVPGGAFSDWLANSAHIAQTPGNLREMIPSAGFLMHGSTKIFGLPGAALAFYLTAKPENRVKTLGLLIPAALTSFLTGITEPLEFTFLFVAPFLFAIHAFLSACMAALYYAIGIVLPSSGAIEALANFWIPMVANHAGAVFLHIVIGLAWIAAYAFLFRFLILKFNLETPGREAGGDVKLHTKQEYKAMKAEEKATKVKTPNTYAKEAKAYVELLGGLDNIENVSNCATRLRITVKDNTKVASREAFKELGAAGLVAKEKSYQVIIGPTVSNVRAEIDDLMR
jgi:alpha-glucoside PTS system EIICB component